MRQYRKTSILTHRFLEYSRNILTIRTFNKHILSIVFLLKKKKYHGVAYMKTLLKAHLVSWWNVHMEVEKKKKVVSKANIIVLQTCPPQFIPILEGEQVLHPDTDNVTEAWIAYTLWIECL